MVNWPDKEIFSNMESKTIGDHHKFKALYQIIMENNELIRSVTGLQLIIRLAIVEKLPWWF
jgi:hypothetical protein